MSVFTCVTPVDLLHCHGRISGAAVFSPLDFLTLLPNAQPFDDRPVPFLVYTAKIVQ